MKIKSISSELANRILTFDALWQKKQPEQNLLEVAMYDQYPGTPSFNSSHPNLNQNPNLFQDPAGVEPLSVTDSMFQKRRRVSLEREQRLYIDPEKLQNLIYFWNSEPSLTQRVIESLKKKHLNVKSEHRLELLPSTHQLSTKNLTSEIIQKTNEVAALILTTSAANAYLLAQQVPSQPIQGKVNEPFSFKISKLSKIDIL